MKNNSAKNGRKNKRLFDQICSSHDKATRNGLEGRYGNIVMLPAILMFLILLVFHFH